jgi:hypothetical protein
MKDEIIFSPPLQEKMKKRTQKCKEKKLSHRKLFVYQIHQTKRCQIINFELFCRNQQFCTTATAATTTSTAAFSTIVSSHTANQLYRYLYM